MINNDQIITVHENSIRVTIYHRWKAEKLYYDVKKNIKNEKRNRLITFISKLIWECSHVKLLKLTNGTKSRKIEENKSPSSFSFQRNPYEGAFQRKRYIREKSKNSDDDELFLWYGWPTKSVWPYFQLGPLSEFLTIANLRHAASMVWTCAKPGFRLRWMKLCSRDNHYTTRHSRYLQIL